MDKWWGATGVGGVEAPTDADHAPPARCDDPLVVKRVWETSGSPYGRSVQRLGRLPGVVL